MPATYKTNPAGNIMLHDLIITHLHRFRETSFTRNEFAKLAGIPANIITKYESEGRKLDVGEFLYVCLALSANPLLLFKFVLAGQKEVQVSAVTIPSQSKEQVGIVDNNLPTFSSISKKVGLIIAEFFVKTREGAGLSQKQAGALINTHVTYIEKVEGNKGRLNLGEFEQLCKAYKIEVCDALATVINRYNAQAVAVTNPTL